MDITNLGGPFYICQGEYMLKPLREMEAIFKALADTTRLRILGLLLTGEVCVCHIHESLKVPQSKASRHLAYLRRSGLVETRREGLWIYYRMAHQSDPGLQTISQTVAHGLAHMDVVRRDADRLARTNGCCLPVPGEATLACCSPAPVSIVFSR